jgi:hypothetical protein
MGEKLFVIVHVPDKPIGESYEYKEVRQGEGLTETLRLLEPNVVLVTRRRDLAIKALRDCFAEEATMRSVRWALRCQQRGGDLLQQCELQAGHSGRHHVRGFHWPARGPCGMRYHADDCDCEGAGGDR